MEEINPHKCIARVWNKGYGGQCSHLKKVGEYCKKHISEENRWCGILTEPRPRNPINSKGKKHTWNCDKVKKGSVKEPVKESVKEPVKKKIPLHKQDPIIEETSDEEVTEEIKNQKEVSEEVSEEVTEEIKNQKEVSEELLISGDDVVLQGDILTYQGKEYYIVDETFKILDEGLEEIGKWDPVKKIIVFL